MPSFFHYTDRDGWNGLRSQVTWCFRAVQPRSSDRPVGAYFTDIQPTPANKRTLFKRLRVPKNKQDYVFDFIGSDGLSQLFGGRGRDQRIFFSPIDYEVIEDRQRFKGPTEEWPEHPS